MTFGRLSKMAARDESPDHELSHARGLSTLVPGSARLLRSGRTDINEPYVRLDGGNGQLVLPGFASRTNRLHVAERARITNMIAGDRIDTL